MTDQPSGFVLMFAYQDRKGIVAAVANSLASQDCNITPVATAWRLEGVLHDLRVELRALVTVSKGGHCLNDLLSRTHTGRLPMTSFLPGFRGAQPYRRACERGVKMIAPGQGTEGRVLARGVKGHLDHRILLNGQRTVAFR